MTRDNKRINSKGDFADYMSAEELKSRFYDHFRDTGTLAQLRSQLRSKLVNEVFKVASSQNETESNDDKEDSLLPLQVGNWLVYDHMKRLGLEYSLSTFVSEANLPYPKKLLSIKDILHILGIESGSPEYEPILSAYTNNNKEGFLYIFISTLMKKTDRDNLKDLTLKAKTVEPSIDKESFRLSDYYPSKVFNETSNDFELPFKEARSYTEAVVYKQLQQEKDKHEREIKQLRQKLLTELDTLYTHEQEARIEIERKKMKLVHEQELLNLQKEKLKMKEMELEGKVKTLELESEAKANSVEENLLQKKKELDERESHLNETQQRLSKEQAELKAKEGFLSETFETQFTRLQKSYKTLQDEYAAILNENGRFQVELKQMSDYSAIKEELIWKSKKLEHVEKELMLLRTQLHQEKLSSLQSMQKLQQQLMNEASTHHFGAQNITTVPMDSLAKNEIEAREPISQSNQQYKELLTRIEDQRQDIQELHRLIHNLHYEPFGKQDQATSTVPVQTKESEVISPRDTLTRKPSNQRLLQQKLYEETNRRIKELIEETDAMEYRYSEYMFGRPNLYPNIYIPYNTTAPLHLEDVKMSLANDKKSLQNLSNSFRNFGWEFGSNMDHNSKISNPLLLATYPRDQERTHHMHKFLELLHQDVTPNLAYDMTSKFESFNANQPFSDPFPKESKDIFTSRKAVEEITSTNGQKSMFPDTFERERATLNDVTRSNISTHQQLGYNVDHAQNMHNSVPPIVDLSTRSTNSTITASHIPFQTSGNKGKNTSGQVGNGNAEVSEKSNSRNSNDVENLKLDCRNKGDTNEHPLQVTHVQMKRDSKYKLNNGVYEPKKLLSATSLEPILTTKKPNTSVPDDLPIDLDAVWKQTSKSKGGIFKINSTSINTFSSNEVKSVNDKSLVGTRDTVKRKLSFDEIPSQNANSPSKLILPKDTSQSDAILESALMLNSALDKNTVQLNSSSEVDQPVLDSISEKVVSLKNSASEKDALPPNATLKDVFPLNSASEKSISQLNSVSEKKTSLKNSISEKTSAPLNLASERDASPLNVSASEKDTSQQKSNPELGQDRDLAQKSPERLKSENNSNTHDENARSKSTSGEQRASSAELASVKQPTPESIPAKEQSLAVYEQVPVSKNYSKPGSLHELEARNSVSEISSGELDDKDSSNANISELSALNLSAGSELEQTKNDEEEDGW